MSKRYRYITLLCTILCTLRLSATIYEGRVVDANGQGLMYATIYLQQSPEIGTATNQEGFFSLSIDTIPEEAVLIFSSMGYLTQMLPLTQWPSTPPVISMDEQPILLSTTVVDAKKTRQSKRKKMATLLHAVYERLQEQSPTQPVQYRVVSDVKMDARESAWGMEQMIASVIEIPSTDITQADSIQFVAQSCKRYCDPRVRKHVDQLYKEETDATRKHLAVAIDSGTIVHRMLWEMSQMDKSVLLDLSDELSRWQMEKVDDQYLMLTYKRKRSFFLGVVKLTEVHHLLVDNDASLQTYICDEYIQLFLPFSIKIKDADLSWVNLLNMDDNELQKFRLKKANMHVLFETNYELLNGVRVPTRKTTQVNAMLEDNKGKSLPCNFQANQQIVSTRLTGVYPFPYYRKGQRVARQIVPIY